MNGALAICKRDLRKFVRQPAIILATLILPFIFLVLIGFAFGGAIVHVPVAIVQESYGKSSNELVELLQGEQSCVFGGMNCENAFQLVDVPDLGTAQKMLAAGSVKAIVHIPSDFDTSLPPKLDVLLDTTDPLTAGTILVQLTQADQQLAAQTTPAPADPPIDLVVSAFYRNVLYIEFMAPGSLVQAVFIASVIGGGITLLDDKERGVIEGYLVTPLRRYEIVLGVLLAGVIKAVFSASVMLVLAILVAGIRLDVGLNGFILVLLTLLLTALGIISMMTAYAVRAPSREAFQFTAGPFNFVLFFTSGAVYPIQAFPGWMRMIASINPETYAVHALRILMFKGGAINQVAGDFSFLVVFTLIMVLLATLAFKRSL